MHFLAEDVRILEINVVEVELLEEIVTDATVKLVVIPLAELVISSTAELVMDPTTELVATP